MAMRRGWLGLVISMLVACGGGDDGALKHGATTPASGAGDATNGGAAPGATANGAPAGPAAACPASLPTAILLATDGNVADLRIVDGMIWFRSDTNVVTMAKDGVGRATKYTSAALVSTYVERESMLHVESPNPPDAVLVRTSLDGKVLAQAAEPWTAASTHVFGDDGEYYYLVAEVENGVGDTVYRVSKTTLAAEMLASFGEGDENAITYAQLAYPNIWFVRGQKRAYEVPQLAQTDADGDVIGLEAQPATEIFASAIDDCRLAVDSKSAYCSNGAALVKRDLLGANPTTVLDETMSAVKAAIGAPLATANAIAVLPDASARSVIRLLASDGKESIAACGRDGIGEVAVDAESVVWAESGASKGLYLASR